MPVKQFEYISEDIIELILILLYNTVSALDVSVVVVWATEPHKCCSSALSS